MLNQDLSLSNLRYKKDWRLVPSMLASQVGHAILEGKFGYAVVLPLIEKWRNVSSSFLILRLQKGVKVMKNYVKPRLEYIELTVNERLAGVCSLKENEYPGTCWS